MTPKQLDNLCDKFLNTLDKFSITHEDMDKMNTKGFVHTHELVEYWASQGAVDEPDDV